MMVNLKDPRVEVGVITANGFPKADETFQSMIARENPTLAVDGAYFDKTTKIPIGDVRERGQTLFEGMMGTCLAIDGLNQCHILRVTKGHAMNWEPYPTVLGCGPALLLNGKVDVDWQTEGFHDPHVMGSKNRMGVGYTKGGQMIIANILGAVTYEQEAGIFQQLGCYEAMNLDAGASQAIYFDKKYIQQPGRNLTNLLAVWVHDKPSFARSPLLFKRSESAYNADLYQNSYDVKKEQAFNGTIVSGFGLSNDEPADGSAVIRVKKPDGSAVSVVLGPSSYVRKVSDFHADESVQVSGEEIEVNGEKFILARRIMDRRMVYLRDANGAPLWTPQA